MTCRVPVSVNSIVPRYRPGALSGVNVAPAIMGDMPAIVMLVLSVTVLAWNLAGDALRDILDPRLRRR